MFLDTVVRRPSILEILVKTRVLRISVAMWAIAVVLSLSVLPVAHIHASESGRTLVHSHFGDGAEADHHDTLGHGDHQKATSLARAFVVEGTYQPLPLVATPMFELASPDVTPVSVVGDFRHPVIHGPPRQTASLRAPPA